ncbi:MAG TPA: hypothetical protein VFI54_03845 [Solirubrobacteraceae bacterium]|nr:hypothetical protein [Solirubrobacteraceae bacterium]
MDACSGHGKLAHEHDQDPRWTIKTVPRQQEYGARLQTEGKVQARHHLLDSHGGAWIYDVEVKRGTGHVVGAGAGLRHRQLWALALIEQQR